MRALRSCSRLMFSILSTHSSSHSLLPAPCTHGGHEWQGLASARSHWGASFSSLLRGLPTQLSTHPALLSSSSSGMAQRHFPGRALAASVRSFASPRSPVSSPKPATRGRAPSTAPPTLPEEIARKQVAFCGVVIPAKDNKSCRIEVDDADWQKMKPDFFNRWQLPKVTSNFKRKRDNTTVRVLMPMLLQPGTRCKVNGSYVFSEVHGLQVKSSHFDVLPPTTENAVRMTLEAIDGVSKKTSESVWNALGAETIPVMDSDVAIQRLQESGYGSRKVCQNLKRKWDAHRAKHTQAGFLQLLGLKPKDCEALERLYGAECEAVMRADPYLALLRPTSIGLSLRMADDIALQLGVLDQHVVLRERLGSGEGSKPVVTSSSPTRGAVAMLEVLMSTAGSSGNTFERWRELSWKATKHLDTANHETASWLAASSGSEDMVQGKASQEQSSLSSTDDEAEDVPDAAEAAQPLWEHGDSTPQVWASILMGLRRMVMEVHTSDPLQPPSPISMPQIDRFSRTVPESILKPRANRSSSIFPYHAIAYLDALHDAEVEVARRLGGLIKAAKEEPAVHSNGTSETAVAEALQAHTMLTPTQRQAVQEAAHTPVMLLTGAAGCGKTYTTQAIVATWLRQGKSVKLCAPTGRAAQRLQEAVGDQQAALPPAPTQNLRQPASPAKPEAGSRSVTASTIHRMLGYTSTNHEEEERLKQQHEAQQEQQGSPSVEAPRHPDSASSSSSNNNTLLLGGAFFEHNEVKPLQADAVLVDEASMLDVQLMAALLCALPAGCQLVLVGDPHQLPPVGPGSVLQDCVRSRAFPQVHLDEIFRQAEQSNIVLGAHEIIHGRTPATKLPCLSLDEALAVFSPSGEQQGNGSSESVSSPARSEAALMRLQRALGGDGMVLQMAPSSTSADVASALQEIVKSLGQLGVRLAEDVQVLSPTKNKDLEIGTPWLNRQLQPIMNPSSVSAGDSQDRWGTFRVRDRVIQLTNNYEAEVFNGDLGTVIPSPQGAGRDVCTVEYAPRPGTTEPHRVSYAGLDRFQLHHAWATTVHKAQGGQFPVVVLPLHEATARYLLSPQLLYTAVTRAQRLLLLITTEAALGCISSGAGRGDRPRNSLLAPRLMHRLLGVPTNAPPLSGSLNGMPTPVQPDSLRSLVPGFVLPPAQISQRPSTPRTGLTRTRQRGRRIAASPPVGAPSSAATPSAQLPQCPAASPPPTTTATTSASPHTAAPPAASAATTPTAAPAAAARPSADTPASSSQQHVTEQAWAPRSPSPPPSPSALTQPPPHHSAPMRARRRASGAPHQNQSHSQNHHASNSAGLGAGPEEAVTSQAGSLAASNGARASGGAQPHHTEGGHLSSPSHPSPAPPSPSQQQQQQQQQALQGGLQGQHQQPAAAAAAAAAANGNAAVAVNGSGGQNGTPPAVPRVQLAGPRRRAARQRSMSRI